MPKSGRSLHPSQDPDKQLSSTHRGASESSPNEVSAEGGLTGTIRRFRAAPSLVSPTELVTLQRVVGMRAVGSLMFGSLQRQRTDESFPSEPAAFDTAGSSSSIANASSSVGGKGLDGFAIRAPGNEDEKSQDETEPTGGKGQDSPILRYLQTGGRAFGDDERARYHEEIATFQSQNPHEKIVARQRAVLDEPSGGGIRTDDQSGTLRRKGKDSASGGKGASGGTPPVLSKKNVQGPSANDRGGYNWVVQWELDKPSPSGGWIVQGVNVAGDVKDKDGKALKTGWESYVPYWEAWQVRAGKKVTTYAEGGDVLDDTFANPSYAAGSKGEVSETGSPQFYEGLTLPTSFKANGVVPAGILPATKSDPGLSGGSGTIAHEIKATWDSSKGDNKTTLKTS